MPKRSRSGLVSMPARVVAPTSVKGGRSSLTERAAGPLADHDVDLVVLERRDRGSPRRRASSRWISSMNRTSLGSRLVRIAARSPGALEHGARGLAQVHAHLARDDVRERGLAEPRRAEEQHVVERLLALARRLDEDRRAARGSSPARRTRRACLGRSARSIALFLRRGRRGGDEAVGFDHERRDLRVIVRMALTTLRPAASDAWRMASSRPQVRGQLLAPPTPPRLSL